MPTAQNKASAAFRQCGDWEHERSGRFQNSRGLTEYRRPEHYCSAARLPAHCCGDLLGGFWLYNSTKESIELQGRVNVVQAAKDYDAFLLVRKNTVMLAGHVVDEMVREAKPNSDILDYLTAESLSIKKSIDADYTGLYGWINDEYLDGVGWVPDEDYIPTERPWYQEALADDSAVTFVKPYLDEQTGAVLTTIAQ